MYSILGRLEDFFVFVFFLDVISYFLKTTEKIPREHWPSTSMNDSVCQTMIITSQRVTKCILMTFF